MMTTDPKRKRWEKALRDAERDARMNPGHPAWRRVLADTGRCIEGAEMLGGVRLVGRYFMWVSP